jgi:hypothetical protein
MEQGPLVHTPMRSGAPWWADRLGLHCSSCCMMQLCIGIGCCCRLCRLLLCAARACCTHVRRLLPLLPADPKARSVQYNLPHKDMAAPLVGELFGLTAHSSSSLEEAAVAEEQQQQRRKTAALPARGIGCHAVAAETGCAVCTLPTTAAFLLQQVASRHECYHFDCSLCCCVCTGPAHPYQKDGIAAGLKNHRAGHVEDTHLHSFAFDEQYNTYHR